ncbi:MAG: cyclase family protein [Thermomicrobiales bacterium]|nr:cyclase family protein [Thermomicrobiales bacterium]
MNDHGGYEALAAALGNVEIVDLTVPLAEGLPANWPTHMPFQRKVYNWYAAQDHPTQPLHGFRGPYYTAFLTLDEHCGTHIDSPAHFIPPPDSGLPHASEMGLITLDKVPLNRMMGPARVVDATDLKDTGEPGTSPQISTEHVLRHEADYGKLEPGDIVLFRSDWDEHYVPIPDGGGAYAADPFLAGRGPGWPAPGIPCLELLLERGVMTLGLDGVSVGGVDDPAPAHHYGLGKGMLYIELLANLKKLPPNGAWFVYLPLNIRGGSAGPGRAIAFVPK